MLSIGPISGLLATILSPLTGLRVSAADINGMVVENHTGAPLAQARVVLSHLPGRTGMKTTESGVDGHFRITGIAAGQYRLDIAKEGYANNIFFGTADALISVHGRLSRTGAISGQVMNESGKPITGAIAYLMSKSSEASPQRNIGDQRQGYRVRVDDRGHYRLYGIPPGEYAVAISYSDSETPIGSGLSFAPGDGQVRWFRTSDGADIRDADIVIPKGPSYAIRGRVVAADPDNSILLTLTLLEAPSLIVAQTVSDKGGVFHFDRVRPGSYNLFAAGPSSGNGGWAGILGDQPVFGSLKIEIVDRDLTDLSFPVVSGHTLSFVLSSPSLAAGVPECPREATLQLNSVDNWGARVDRVMQIRHDSPTSAKDLAPTRYFVTLTGLGDACHYTGNSILDLSHLSDPTETISVHLSPGAALRGNFLVTGEAPPGDFVLLVRADEVREGDSTFLAILPDKQGRFSLDGIRPGKYHVSFASKRDWSDSDRQPDVAGVADIEFLPAVTTRLELVVSDPRRD